MVNKKPAVIFDMDGTILNAKEKLEIDVIKTFERLGIKIDREETKGDWHKLAQSYGLSKERFSEEFDRSESWEESVKKGRAPLYKDALKCLEELYKQNVKMGLFSKSKPDHTEAKIKGHGLEKYFEGNVRTIPRQIKNGKYRGAREIIGDMGPYSIQKVYSVGDDTEDAESAKFVGRYYRIPHSGILIDRESEKIQEKNSEHKTIKSLEEIPEILNENPKNQDSP